MKPSKKGTVITMFNKKRLLVSMLVVIATFATVETFNVFAAEEDTVTENESGADEIENKLSETEDDTTEYNDNKYETANKDGRHNFDTYGEYITANIKELIEGSGITIFDYKHPDKDKNDAGDTKENEANDNDGKGNNNGNSYNSKYSTQQNNKDKDKNGNNGNNDNNLNYGNNGLFGFIKFFGNSALDLGESITDEVLQYEGQEAKPYVDFGFDVARRTFRFGMDVCEEAVDQGRNHIKEHLEDDVFATDDADAENSADSTSSEVTTEVTVDGSDELLDDDMMVNTEVTIDGSDELLDDDMMVDTEDFGDKHFIKGIAKGIKKGFKKMAYNFKGLFSFD